MILPCCTLLLWLIPLVYSFKHGKESVQKGKNGSHIEYDQINLDYISNDHMLNDWKLTESKTKDFRNQHYYFFEFPYDMVSSQMGENKWESALNNLFRDEWANYKSKKPNTIVLDVGVNFGSFYMFAASQGCNIVGFEMQPKLYTIVELGIRISGYKPHAILHHAAVWYTEQELSFTPNYYHPKKYNLGYTILKNDTSGNIKINTSRIDHYISAHKVSTFNLL